MEILVEKITDEQAGIDLGAVARATAACSPSDCSFLPGGWSAALWHRPTAMPTAGTIMMVIITTKTTIIMRTMIGSVGR